MNKKRRKLNIAQVAPLIETVPPKKYGGTERIVNTLTEGLVQRGHKVTLFASGNSTTSARLVSVFPRSLREAKVKDLYGINDLTLLHVGSPYLYDEFDIIHDHNSPSSLPLANYSRIPVIITLHGPISTTNRQIFKTFRNPYLVAISESQARAMPEDANLISVVHHGLEMNSYPFSKENDGYLLFVGRISMDKGTHIAIEVSQALNMPLIIAAKLDKEDKSYYRDFIEQSLSDPELDQVQWIGEVDEDTRNKLMSKAFCLLHPVIFREPFGLTLIESGACGCPVIAFNKGSIPEIVADGKTGFVVDDVPEMVDAVEKIPSIDRLICRKHILENFSADKMVDRYEELYYQILENRHAL